MTYWPTGSFRPGSGTSLACPPTLLPNPLGVRPLASFLKHSRCVLHCTSYSTCSSPSGELSFSRWLYGLHPSSKGHVSSEAFAGHPAENCATHVLSHRPPLPVCLALVHSIYAIYSRVYFSHLLCVWFWGVGGSCCLFCFCLHPFREKARFQRAGTIVSLGHRCFPST